MTKPPTYMSKQIDTSASKMSIVQKTIFFGLIPLSFAAGVFAAPLVSIFGGEPSSALSLENIDNYNLYFRNTKEGVRLVSFASESIAPGEGNEIKVDADYVNFKTADLFSRVIIEKGAKDPDNTLQWRCRKNIDAQSCQELIHFYKVSLRDGSKDFIRSSKGTVMVSSVDAPANPFPASNIVYVGTEGSTIVIGVAQQEEIDKDNKPGHH